MANQTYYPQEQSELANWARLLAAQAAVHAAAAGLPPALVASLDASADAYRAALTAHQEAVSLAQSKRAAKDDARRALLENVRQVHNLMRSNPALEPSLLAQLGFPLPQPWRRAAPLYTPEGVVATADGMGTATLRWQRAGNTRGALFIVERARENGDWEPVGFGAGTRLRLAGLPVGVRQMFRVRATRDGRSSEPSAVVVVY